MLQATSETTSKSTRAARSLSGGQKSRRAADRVNETQGMLAAVMPLQSELPSAAELDATCRRMMGLLNQVARRFARRLPAHVELDELVGAGSVGLVAAVRQHHAAPQPVLVRLAEQRIRGAILDHLRAADHLTRRQRAAVTAVNRVKTRLEREGKDSNAAIVAKELGITEQRAERIENRLASVQLVAADCTEQLCSPAPIPEEHTIREESRERVVMALKRLPRRLQTLLSLYYFEELTYKQIGELLGISRSRISQLHTQAMELLRLELAPTVAG